MKKRYKRKKGPVRSKKVVFDGIQFASGLEKYMYIALKKAKIHADYEGATFVLQEDFKFQNSYQFNQIYNWSEENLNDECIEYIVSMMMEPYDNIVNPLITQMSSDEEEHFNIPVDRTIEDLRNILESKYSEILKIDFLKDENNQNFWFISKNKEEPRIGDRYIDEGSDLEQPLAIARDINKLYETVFTKKNSSKIGKFLKDNNHLRHVVRRAFIA